MTTFDGVTLIHNEQPVDQSIINVPLTELKNRTDYLRIHTLEAVASNARQSLSGTNVSTAVKECYAVAYVPGSTVMVPANVNLTIDSTGAVLREPGHLEPIGLAVKVEPDLYVTDVRKATVILSGSVYVLAEDLATAGIPEGTVTAGGSAAVYSTGSGKLTTSYSDAAAQSYMGELYYEDDDYRRIFVNPRPFFLANKWKSPEVTGGPGIDVDATDTSVAPIVSIDIDTTGGTGGVGECLSAVSLGSEDDNQLVFASAPTTHAVISSTGSLLAQKLNGVVTVNKPATVISDTIDMIAVERVTEELEPTAAFTSVGGGAARAFKKYYLKFSGETPGVISGKIQLPAIPEGDYALTVTAILDEPVDAGDYELSAGFKHDTTTYSSSKLSEDGEYSITTKLGEFVMSEAVDKNQLYVTLEQVAAASATTSDLKLLGIVYTLTELTFNDLQLSISQIANAVTVVLDNDPDDKPDNTVTWKYAWLVDDGTEGGSSNTLSHTFSALGMHIITLSVAAESTADSHRTASLLAYVNVTKIPED